MGVTAETYSKRPFKLFFSVTRHKVLPAVLLGLSTLWAKMEIFKKIPTNADLASLIKTFTPVACVCALQVPPW